jgi:hypothetical protein
MEHRTNAAEVMCVLVALCKASDALDASDASRKVKDKVNTLLHPVQIELSGLVWAVYNQPEGW